MRKNTRLSKQIIKAITVGLSASMMLQPVAAFAESTAAVPADGQDPAPVTNNAEDKTVTAEAAEAKFEGEDGIVAVAEDAQEKVHTEQGKLSALYVEENNSSATQTATEVAESAESFVKEATQAVAEIVTAAKASNLVVNEAAKSAVPAEEANGDTTPEEGPQNNEGSGEGAEEAPIGSIAEELEAIEGDLVKETKDAEGNVLTESDAAEKAEKAIAAAKQNVADANVAIELADTKIDIAVEEAGKAQEQLDTIKEAEGIIADANKAAQDAYNKVKQAVDDNRSDVDDFEGEVDEISVDAEDKAAELAKAQALQNDPQTDAENAVDAVNEALKTDTGNVITDAEKTIEDLEKEYKEKYESYASAQQAYNEAVLKYNAAIEATGKANDYNDAAEAYNAAVDGLTSNTATANTSLDELAANVARLKEAAETARDEFNQENLGLLIIKKAQDNIDYEYKANQNVAWRNAKQDKSESGTDVDTVEQVDKETTTYANFFNKVVEYYYIPVLKNGTLKNLEWHVDDPAMKVAYERNGIDSTGGNVLHYCVVTYTDNETGKEEELILHYKLSQMRDMKDDKQTSWYDRHEDGKFSGIVIFEKTAHQVIDGIDVSSDNFADIPAVTNEAGEVVSEASKEKYAVTTNEDGEETKILVDISTADDAKKGGKYATLDLTQSHAAEGVTVTADSDNRNQGIGTVVEILDGKNADGTANANEEDTTSVSYSFSVDENGNPSVTKTVSAKTITTTYTGATLNAVSAETAKLSTELDAKKKFVEDIKKEISKDSNKDKTLVINGNEVDSSLKVNETTGNFVLVNAQGEERVVDLGFEADTFTEPVYAEDGKYTVNGQFTKHITKTWDVRTGNVLDMDIIPEWLDLLNLNDIPDIGSSADYSMTAGVEIGNEKSKIEAELVFLDSGSDGKKVKATVPYHIWLVGDVNIPVVYYEGPAYIEYKEYETTHIGRSLFDHFFEDGYNNLKDLFGGDFSEEKAREIVGAEEFDKLMEGHKYIGLDFVDDARGLTVYTAPVYDVDSETLFDSSDRDVIEAAISKAFEATTEDKYTFTESAHLVDGYEVTAHKAPTGETKTSYGYKTLSYILKKVVESTDKVVIGTEVWDAIEKQSTVEYRNDNWYTGDTVFATNIVSKDNVYTTDKRLTEDISEDNASRIADEAKKFQDALTAAANTAAEYVTLAREANEAAEAIQTAKTEVSKLQNKLGKLDEDLPTIDFELKELNKDLSDAKKKLEDAKTLKKNLEDKLDETKIELADKISKLTPKEEESNDPVVVDGEDKKDDNNKQDDNKGDKKDDDTNTTNNDDDNDDDDDDDDDDDNNGGYVPSQQISDDVVPTAPTPADDTPAAPAAVETPADAAPAEADAPAAEAPVAAPAAAPAAQAPAAQAPAAQAPAAQAADAGDNNDDATGAPVATGETQEIGDELTAKADAPETQEIGDELTAKAAAPTEEMEDPETPLAALPEAAHMNWWWLLLVLILGTTGAEMYRRHLAKKNAQTTTENTTDKQ